MGKGKAWGSPELFHLALSYINVSEDQGNNRVNGTNQAMDAFFKRVIESFKEKAPADTPEGTYGERTPEAILRQWREGIKAGVRKFNKAINVVLNGKPSGVTEDQKINVAVAIICPCACLHTKVRQFSSPILEAGRVCGICKISL